MSPLQSENSLTTLSLPVHVGLEGTAHWIDLRQSLDAWILIP